jgi:hypothetical protein
VLMRPLVERAAMVSYILLHPDAVAMWLSEGLFKSIFGSHAAIAQLSFMLLCLGILIGLTAVRFWKWFSRNL